MSGMTMNPPSTTTRNPPRNLAKVQWSEQRMPLDSWLLFAVLGLTGFGVVMVASSSMNFAEAQKVSANYYLIRHIVAIILGSGLGYCLYRLPMALVERYSIWLIWPALVFLLMPFIPGLGVRINGAMRWIHLGVTNFQVVEVTKIILVLYMAGYCVRQRAQLPEHWKGILKPLVMTSLAVFLLLLQPDFGSATLVLAVSFGLLWLAGARASHFLVIVTIGVLAMGGIAILEPYRLQRFVGFIDPWKDQFNGGYQLTQALIAIGRGEWFGVGLGDSVLKLSYLPEAHSDFVLAIIAEELGFFGIVLVFGLFATLVGRAFELGAQAAKKNLHYAAFVAYGLALGIALQTLISAGVNLGVLPTKGLTLPLISSGGSSVMITVAMLGLLFNVSNLVRSTPDPALGSAGKSTAT